MPSRRPTSEYSNQYITDPKKHSSARFILFDQSLVNQLLLAFVSSPGIAAGRLSCGALMSKHCHPPSSFFP
jgi:hypothetical protein